MSRRVVGRTADGESVEDIRIAAGGLTAHVLTWGAVLRDLRLAACDWPLTLGFERFEDYPAHSPHFGAVCGRVANRIADGRFVLDGRACQVERGPGEAHHLHGGPTAGFGVRPWRVTAAAPDSVTLTLASPDGDGGYPGALAVSCVYRLAPPATLVVELTATADAPTVVNLAQHSYWNLDGDGDVRAHRLTIAADAITETDAALIPTGSLRPVAGTPWDFRSGRLIGAPDAVPYDVNFALADARAAAPRFAARLEGARGVSMAVWTTEPGLQLYDAAGLSVSVPGLGGRRYGPQAGVCLEAQAWPDAPNQPGFPSVVLRPGEAYRQVTELRFERG
jgi:aldose 1-epimerase